MARTCQLQIPGASDIVESGRVDDGGEAAAHPHGQNLVEHRKCIVARGQIKLVLAHDRSQGVGTQNLFRAKVLSRPGALPRGWRANQDDERRRGECNAHPAS
jgi:hypothetical protein